MVKVILSESNKNEVFQKIEKFLNKEGKQYTFLAVDYVSADGSLPAVEQALTERNRVLEATFKDAIFEPGAEVETKRLASIAIDNPIKGEQAANDLHWGDSVYISRNRMIVFGKADQRLIDHEGDPIDILEEIPGSRLGKLFEITYN